MCESVESSYHSSASIGRVGSYTQIGFRLPMERALLTARYTNKVMKGYTKDMFDFAREKIDEFKKIMKRMDINLTCVLTRGSRCQELVQVNNFNLQINIFMRRVADERINSIN